MKKWQSERCLTSCNAEIENEWSYAFILTYIGYVMFFGTGIFLTYRILGINLKIIYFNNTLIL